jgi:hypothetical protein
MKRLLLILLILSLSAQAWGACPSGTCYVAVGTGSDAAAGTIDAPLATMEYAAENVAASNDSIILRAGDYNQSAGIWKSSGSDQTIDANKNLAWSAYTGATVNIDMPANIGGNQFFKIGGTVTFSHLNFTNSTAVAKYIFWLKYNAATALTVADSTFDFGNAAFPMSKIDASLLGYNASVTYIRDKFSNLAASQAVINNTIGGGFTATITFKSCLVHHAGWLLQNAAGSAINLTMQNNTVVNLKNTTTFSGTAATDAVLLENNIFRADATYTFPVYAPNYLATNWTVNNNIIYRAVTADPGTEVDSLATGGSYIFPITAATNYYVDPVFTNEGANNYIPAGVYVSGRGKAASLPVGGDLTGASWTGSDIGCYANPSVTASMPTIVPGTIAFVGDSLSQGTGTRAVTDAWLPYTVVASGNLGAAIGGSSGEALKWLVDRVAVSSAPQYIVLFSWHNNFKSAANVPVNLTAQQASDDMMIAVAKVKYWGITPIVLGQIGISAADAAAAQYTKATALNDIIAPACITNTCLYASPLERMLMNGYWYNAYNNANDAQKGYYGATKLSADVHPNVVGYDLIISLLEDLIGGNVKYYLTQGGTPVVGTTYGPATSRYPISIVGLNAQSALPYGVAGITVSAAGTFTTPIDTPAAGTSNSPFTLIGGLWPSGNIFDQQYWTWQNAIVKCSSGDGLTVSAVNDNIFNLDIIGCVNGINHSENTTVKNTIFNGTTTDINTTGGTATTAGNLAHTTDAKFVSVTDYYLLPTSPAINAGANLCATLVNSTDFAGRPVCVNSVYVGKGSAPEIGAYEYWPLDGGSSFQKFNLGFSW